MTTIDVKNWLSLHTFNDNILNLDDLDYEQLVDLCSIVKGYDFSIADALWPDEQYRYEAVRRYYRYAQHKMLAMECRLRGKIDIALDHENVCDRIYHSLPEFAKW